MGAVSRDLTRGVRPKSRRAVLRPGGVWPVVFLLLPLSGGGCHTAGSNAAIGVGLFAGTLFLAQAPGQEIEQVYYLGVFDPREQLPSQVYRVTVHGQASAISAMKFGSGWVPAKFIDSLSSRVQYDKDVDRPTITPADKEQEVSLSTGRRLMMFGPEGFREAPRDYRLVIVMGASPEAFFNAIDQSLGIISQVQQAKGNADVVRQLTQARQQLQSEQNALSQLDKDVATDLAEPRSAGGKP